MADDDDDGDDDKNSLVQRALDLALSLDEGDIIKYVEAKRRARPLLDAKALARRIVSDRASMAGAEGFVTGLPSTPATAIPAAIADVG